MELSHLNQLQYAKLQNVFCDLKMNVNSLIHSLNSAEKPTCINSVQDFF